MVRKINKLVIHVSDTPDNKDFSAEDIRRWHKQRGWSDIGYHFVIRIDGTIEKGRDLEIIGAHTKGYNSNSIGICWVGRKKITPKAFSSLTQLCLVLVDKYNLSCENILGHYELNSHKTCPNLDMEEFRDLISKYRFLDV